MAHTAQKLNEARKRADDRYRMMEAVMEEERKVLSMATFERDTSSRIERQARAAKFNELSREYEARLYERRKQLAALYNREMEGWKEEALSRVETVEERKQRYDYFLHLVICYYYWVTNIFLFLFHAYYSYHL